MSRLTVGQLSLLLLTYGSEGIQPSVDRQPDLTVLLERGLMRMDGHVARFTRAGEGLTIQVLTASDIDLMQEPLLLLLQASHATGVIVRTLHGKAHLRVLLAFNYVEATPAEDGWYKITPQGQQLLDKLLLLTE